MYVRCVKLILDFLIDFHVLEGECKRLVSLLCFFIMGPGVEMENINN